MDKKQIVWLHEQLPDWESKGWISKESAAAMKVFYGEVKPKKTPSMSRLLVLLLGVLLLGLGVFLLFAGYWYSFSPAGRLDWCIALLLLAVIMLGVTIWKAPRGSLISEAVGLLYTFILTCVTFLMADTYYTGEGIGIYCLIIMVLTIPLVYVLGSQLMMIAYLLLSLLWSTSAHDISIWGEAIWLWVLLAAGVPFMLERLRAKTSGFLSVLWLAWAYFAALFGAFFFTINSYHLSLSLFFVASLSAVIFALGSVTREQGLWALPSRGIGTLGLIYVVVQGTFLGTWTDEAATSPGIGSLLIALLGLVLVAGALRALWRKNQGLEILITACPLVIGLLTIGVHSGFTSLTASILFNTYIGILALIMLLRGGMTNRVGLVNGCVFAVLAMVGARFFDPAFTFVERGMTFIFAGAVIFVVNAFYMWRKHEEREHINASVGRAGRRLRRKGAGVTDVSGTVARKRVKGSANTADGAEAAGANTTGSSNSPAGASGSINASDTTGADGADSANITDRTHTTVPFDIADLAKDSDKADDSVQGAEGFYGGSGSDGANMGTANTGSEVRGPADFGKPVNTRRGANRNE